jgi:hypothetical protein
MLLSYIRSLLAICSACCAILAPVCVVHWLVRLSPLRQVSQLMQPLDPVFLPASKALAGILPPTVLTMFGAHANIEQGVLSVLLTGTVLLLAFLSKMVQVSQTRTTVSNHRKTHARLLQQIAQQNQQRTVEQKANNRLVLYLRHFDPDQLGVVLARCQQAPCRIIQTDDDKTVLMYNTIETGLTAIAQSLQWINERMRRLRPMDTRPDYRFVLHAVADEHAAQSAARLCQTLEPYCKPSKLLCTQNVADVIKVKGIAAESISLGFYDLADIQGTTELYHLELPG